MDVPTTATQDERTLAMISHLLAFAGYSVPFGNIIGPLIVCQIKKDQSAYVTAQAKESLDFQISVSICFLISLVIVLVRIGFVMMAALGIFERIMVIISTSGRCRPGSKARSTGSRSPAIPRTSRSPIASS